MHMKHLALFKCSINSFAIIKLFMVSRGDTEQIATHHSECTSIPSKDRCLGSKGQENIFKRILELSLVAKISHPP